MIALETKPVLTTAAVNEILAAALKHAANIGSAVTGVVVDDSLTPRALIRMDGADILTVGLATGKARLSAANGAPTAIWRDLIDADPFLGLTIPTTLDRITTGAVIFAGGYPIQVGSRTIGGVGISGGTEDQDDAVARSALHVLAQAEQFPDRTR